jgi:L-fucose isomerase-like protein
MVMTSKIQMVASGDLRPSANETCWPAQADMEARLTAAVARLGGRVERAHPYKPALKHGFIASQKEGLEVFAGIDRDAPLIVAEAVWQYSQHVLPGLIAHRGPILTVANWSGTYPGLVGLLNLNASMTKAGVAYSSLWSETFEDAWFTAKLAEWLATGAVVHDTSHVRPFRGLDAEARKVAAPIAADLRARRAIMGIFDEGCMGMYNAIIPDELLFPLGIFKERLSQSALYYATTQVPEQEARAVFDWLVAKGLQFKFGTDGATELTPDQVVEQCRMYIAAVRLADEFGCEAIGIQYQQGLKDLLPASDLVEGLLNNADRPPVADAAGKVIRDGRAIVHFNEVDECAGLDGILTSRVHRALGQPVETTLHDIRWGDDDRSGSTKDYVWVFEISGAVPAAHHAGGYAGSSSLRQPPMFFRKGGGTLRGISRPGEIVWSRVFQEGGRLKMDIGRGKAVGLPEAETERRWKLTNYEWPMMHGVLYGVSRDQMMARHKANHIQVVYGTDVDAADRAMRTKAALAAELGIEVFLCGTAANGQPLAA